MSENTTLDLEEFMNRVQDDKDLLFELLDIFVQDFHVKREELEKALKSNDAKTVEHVAHFLKGSCGNISAKLLRVYFAELEDRSRRNDLEDTEKYLENIDQEFEKLAIRIGEIRSELQ
jgi:HPt (histidine-containing phosphotransfer) domain-containing protein